MEAIFTIAVVFVLSISEKAYRNRKNTPEVKINSYRRKDHAA